MSKKAVFFLALITVILSLLASVFLERYLAAEFSTWPLLGRWKLLSAQAPVVINTQEVVHTSDSDDISGATQSAEPKLSAVALVSGTQDDIVGAAINITSDGVFVTASSTFAQSGAIYEVVLEDGTTAHITQISPDPATGLDFFRAQTSNVAASAFDSSSQLIVGDKLVFLANSGQTYQTRASAGMVTAAQGDVEHVVFNSDQPSRTFMAQADSSLVAGEAVVDLKGNVVGIWNGTRIVSADVLQQELALYLANPQKISHPGFGFTYQIITQADSRLTGLSAGALVLSAAAAKNAGSVLEPDDIITQVAGNPVNEDNPLEPQLANYKTGDSVTFTVIRNKQQMNVTVKAQ